jgi:hypothetical protein
MVIMSDPLEALRWRDELLQILYWFRGEGLGDSVTPRELLPFLNGEEHLVEQHLDRLVDDGYARRLERSPAHYQLTEFGVREGGRRFADEFAGLTGQAHGECNNPDCSCKTMGPEACAARSHAHT